MRYILPLLAAALSMPALPATPAMAAGAPHVARMTCGRGAFHLSSRAAPGADAPLAPAAQALTVRIAAARRAIPLESAGPATVEGKAVRRAYVGSWACVRGERGAAYVLLGYSCTVDPGEPGDCGGDKEWFRLLDERGRPVDTGVPRDGPARDRLIARLGLSRAMDEGIPMQDALAD